MIRAATKMVTQNWRHWSKSLYPRGHDSTRHAYKPSWFKGFLV